MAFVTPIPEPIRTVTHVAGCLAIYLSSHRALGRWRAASTLSPPPDTDGALDQVPTPGGTPKHGAERDSEKAALAQPHNAAELGLGVRSRSHGSVDCGRPAPATRDNVITENPPSSASVRDETEIDEALAAHSDTESVPAADQVDQRENVTVGPGSTKYLGWIMIILGIMFFTGSLLSAAYTWKKVGDWAKIPIMAKEVIMCLYLGTTWYKEVFADILPRPLISRIVHRKPTKANRPYNCVTENPEGWANTFMYKTRTRVGFGIAMSALMCLDAWAGRLDYIPALSFAVTLSWLRPEWAGPRSQMKWTLATAFGVWATMSLGLELVQWLTSGPTKEPKADLNAQPAIAMWILPIMVAPCLGGTYAVSGLVIKTYMKYEDTLRNPQSRFRDPGAPAPVKYFETRNHPRSAACIIALFIYHRALAYYQDNVSTEERFFTKLAYYEVVHGLPVVVATMLVMEICNGTLKNWFNYTEEWYPTQIVAHDTGEFRDEKSSFQS